MEFINSKTYKNIYILFTQTLQLKYRYSIYAQIAYDEGFIEISCIYKKLASEKHEQAHVLFDYVESNNTTLNNLLLSIRLESNHEKLLEKFALDAVDDKYNKVAYKFRSLQDVCTSTQNDFDILKRNIQNNEVFKKYKKVEWECIKCGYKFIGYEPCTYCVICNSSKSFFKLRHNIM